MLQILRTPIVVELQGWRKSIQSEYLDASFMNLEYIEELHEDTLHKVCLNVYYLHSNQILFTIFFS
ncbi:hypothetical protein Hanom_Chr03g00189101 [Helianthus anomalus]